MPLHACVFKTVFTCKFPWLQRLNGAVVAIKQRFNQLHPGLGSDAAVRELSLQWKH